MKMEQCKKSKEASIKKKGNQKEQLAIKEVESLSSEDSQLSCDNVELDKPIPKKKSRKKFSRQKQKLCLIQSSKRSPLRDTNIMSSMKTKKKEKSVTLTLKERTFLRKKWLITNLQQKHKKSSDKLQWKKKHSNSETMISTVKST